MKIAKIISIFISIVFLCNFTSIIDDTPIYKLKAVYLEKFSLFVSWPEESNIADTTKSFEITVIGENPFEGELVDLYVKGNVKICKKKVDVTFIENIEEINNCQILYVAESANNQFKEIYKAVKDKPILVITDTPGFAEKGAHISFFVSNEGKLNFEINKNRATESEVRISSRLLRIAKIID
ncbi:MAG: YfiR family protein [Melioribacteraceae bacterium]|nr:YfiR family protein [Melioribacteraceae bacterium]